MALPESKYRDLLAIQVHGTVEARVPFGRIDVLCPIWQFEVEPFHSWAHGARQVMGYAFQKPDIRPALAVYGDIPVYHQERMWRKADGMFELFVLKGTKFQMLRSEFRFSKGFVAPDEDVLAALAARKPEPWKWDVMAAQSARWEERIRVAKLQQRLWPRLG